MIMRALLEKVGTIQRLKVLEFIKQSDGITMAEIADHVRLSYMGARGHVSELEKAGLIVSKVRREKVGRPERVYRPSPKGHMLFQSEPMPMLKRALEIAIQLYGAQAAEKILFGVMLSLQKEYAQKIKGNTWEERLSSFVKLRDKEGTLPRIDRRPAEGRAELIEFRPPYEDLEVLYPAVGRMEQDLFEKLIGAPVQRSRSEDSGTGIVRYRIGA